LKLEAAATAKIKGELQVKVEGNAEVEGWSWKPKSQLRPRASFRLRLKAMPKWRVEVGS
jgi:hypothetical protein